MTCCTDSDILLHYTGEAKAYYVDLGEAIRGRTITSLTSVTSADALLAISSTSVITVDTSDYDQDGNAITIEANTGVQFTLTSGTAGSDIDDYTTTVVVKFVTSAGTEQAQVRFKVLSL